MPTMKKVFLAYRPFEGESLFFRLWRTGNAQMPLPEDDPLSMMSEQVRQFAAQMDRQQVHIDEIKRLCHVPID